MLFYFLFVSSSAFKGFFDNCEKPGLVCQAHNEIPQHHEVEANEESQCAPTVRHQGGEGGGLLLGLHLDLAAAEQDPKARQIRGMFVYDWTVQQLVILYYAIILQGVVFYQLAFI